jgi:hypothetical protein
MRAHVLVVDRAPKPIVGTTQKLPVARHAIAGAILRCQARLRHNLFLYRKSREVRTYWVLRSLE